MTACSNPADPVVGAAKAAEMSDRDAYLHYFTPRSQDLLQVIWSNTDASWESLSVGQIEVIETSPMPPSLSGEQRSKVVFREHGRPYAVVVHASGGEWLIDLVDSEGALTHLRNEL